MAESVLDASAIIALLRREPGAERVIEALSGATVSAVNLSEVVGWLSRGGLQDDEVRRTVDELDLDVSVFETEDALASGLMRDATRHLGLSLGDRACLALARRLGLPVLTADRNWAKLKIEVEIKLIR